MNDDLSDGELLLHSFRGRCGHRRQGNLPCATTGCREYGNLTGFDYANIVVKFGDEDHQLWRKLRRE